MERNGAQPIAFRAFQSDLGLLIRAAFHCRASEAAANATTTAINHSTAVIAELPNCRITTPVAADPKLLPIFQEIPIRPEARSKAAPLKRSPLATIDNVYTEPATPPSRYKY